MLSLNKRHKRLRALYNLLQAVNRSVILAYIKTDFPFVPVLASYAYRSRVDWDFTSGTLCYGFECDVMDLV